MFWKSNLTVWNVKQTVTPLYLMMLVKTMLLFLQCTLFICYAACVDDVKLVQMRGGTQYSYVTCTNEGWNTVQCSFVMQLVQMRSNLCRWGVEHGTIFICYATCADEVELVQMRGGTQYSYATCANEEEVAQMRGGIQYNIHLLCSLCR